jgi:hypothetical protein
MVLTLSDCLLEEVIKFSEEMCALHVEAYRFPSWNKFRIIDNIGDF